MTVKNYLVTTCIIAVGLFSCSKKTTPSASEVNAGVAATSVVKVDSAAVKKVTVKPKAKPSSSIPKVIVVSDAGAKRAVDGRMYYDMQGRRYWRNNRDGKYYLYNKSMHNDPDFRAPAKKSS